MPAAMYEYCRPAEGHHLSISSDLVIETDRQLQAHLLCSECEGLLNKGGESWILPLLSTYEGSFPFFEILTKYPPDVIDGDRFAYAAVKNPEIHPEKLLHFAMGIFWKAAVHSWSGSRTTPMIDLGEFTEPVRKYLRAEGDFPEHVALMVGVLPPPNKWIAFYNPYRGGKIEWMNFLFHVPGVEFSLGVGNGLDEEVRLSSFSCQKARPIIVLNYLPDLIEVNKRVWASARKANNVQKYLK
jgi:hypothetical protein